MLATSKNVLFPGWYSGDNQSVWTSALAVSTCDYHLSAYEGDNYSEGHPHRWLAGGYELDTENV